MGTTAKRENGLVVWALLVVSSEEQAGTLTDQRAWAESTARANGWHITREFAGVGSGKAGPRRHVRDLLAALRDTPEVARPSFVMMIRLDRLGREALECQFSLAEIRSLGVKVWTREAGEEKGDKAMERFVSAAKLFVAEQENEVRRDKAEAVYRRKREAGLAIGNKRPYGLELGPDGKDRVMKSHAAALREAFQMRGRGIGYFKIALRLREIAPPHRFKNGREHEVRWTATRVLRLLATEAYSGTAVTAATFAKARRAGERLSANRDHVSNRKYPWPLGGALRCWCGRGMTGLISGRAERRTRYYGCRAYWNHDGRSRMVRAEDLEGAFVDLLRRLRASPAQADRWRRAAASTVSPRMLDRSLREAKIKRAEIARQRDRVWDMHSRGQLRDELLQERLDALGRDRDEVDSTVGRLEEQRALLDAATARDQDAHELFARSGELWMAATAEEQQAIARAVSLTLGGIYVGESDTIEVGAVEDAERQRRRHASGR